MHLPSGVAEDRIWTFFEDEAGGLITDTSMWFELSRPTVFDRAVDLQESVTGEQDEQSIQYVDDEVVIGRADTDYWDPESRHYQDIRAVLWMHQRMASRYDVTDPAWVFVRPDCG